MNSIKRTSSHRHGFTLVELLIVIVIIAILATITVVAYNGIQTKARNTATTTEVAAWRDIFTLYQSSKGSWPSTMQVGKFYCLGTGFPHTSSGPARCQDYRDSGAPKENDSAALMAQLGTIGTVPSSQKYPVDSKSGPYAMVCDGDQYECPSGDLLIVSIFDSSHGATCPATMETQWESEPVLWCQQQLSQ